MPIATDIFINGRRVSDTNPLPTTATISLDSAVIDTEGLASETTATAQLTELTDIEADVEALNALIGAVNETAPANDTASSGLNGRLQRVAQNVASLSDRLPASLGQKAKAAALAVTLANDEDLLALLATNNTALASLLTELGLKANLNETQPVSAASLPLPAGAATQQTVLDHYNAFGTAGATAWTGSGNGSHMQIMKALYAVLIGTLTVDLVDEGGVAYTDANPVPVQIGQLLSSQDSVATHALGGSNTYVPVRVPTLHTSNLSTSLTQNQNATLVAAPTGGNKVYVHHVEISCEVASNINSHMQILSGTNGTVLTRFRMDPGKVVHLWFPNGTLVGAADTLISLKNITATTLTNLEWGVDYSVGP